MYDESKSIQGVEILWDTSRGRMKSVGRDLAALWLDPSLLNILLPLRDEMGTELFQLLVAHSSSLGAKEDYETMVTVFADTFEEGFLAWGRAVGVVGWGRFELSHMDRSAGTARVVVRSPWELVMQQTLDEPWGCPFLRGKMIGIFRYALGATCWADEHSYFEDGEPVVELSLYPSSMTIESELQRLRSDLTRQKARHLQEQVETRTEMLRRSEEKLRAMLSSMDCWVLALDEQKRIVSHHVPSKFAGNRFPNSETVGKSLSDVLPEEAARLLDEAIEGVQEDGEARSVEYEVQSGEEVGHFTASLTPLRTGQGNPCGTTIVVHDLTEGRRREQEQKHLEAQLRQAQKMEALGQLTGGVAHDFNNLLTVIQGNLELVTKAELPDSSSGFVEEARSAAATATTLVHRLLAFSRRQPLRPHHVNPHQLISSMEILLRRIMGERYELEILAEHESEQWECEIDGGQLETSVLNLAINSRDAMPSGGRIAVETRNVDIVEATAEHHGLVPGQYVLVTVSDTGCGMHEDMQARAFEPFFTTKGPGHGSGLGLSMVYGFAKQSGGHAKLHSEVGVGTIVKLYFPRSRRTEDGVASQSSSGSAQRGEGSLVLVVEDCSQVRRLSVQFLESLGYRTLSCGSAREALDLLETHVSIDLLFTDIVLPGEMNGVQLAETARTKSPDLAVLFTSGYIENSVLQQALSDPDFQLVEKPFSKDQLGRRVFDALAARR